MGDEETRCVVCERPFEVDGTPFTVSVDNGEDETWSWFCSWIHVQAWANAGEPAFETPAGTPMARVGGVVAAGCLLTALVLAALVVIGAVAVVKTTL